MAKRFVCLWIIMLALPASVRAQTGFWDRFLPRVHYFEPLVADPLEPRMGIGLIQTNVFERAIEGRERRERGGGPVR